MEEEGERRGVVEEEEQGRMGITGRERRGGLEGEGEGRNGGRGWWRKRVKGEVEIEGGAEGTRRGERYNGKGRRTETEGRKGGERIERKERKGRKRKGMMKKGSNIQEQEESHSRNGDGWVGGNDVWGGREKRGGEGRLKRGSSEIIYGHLTTHSSWPSCPEGGKQELELDLPQTRESQTTYFII